MSFDEKKHFSHLIYGSGAGKTTAAVGSAVRAIGAGKKVLFCSFLKDGTSGETAPLAMLGAQVSCAGNGKFWACMTADEQAEQKQKAARCWGYALEGCADFDLAIFDEAVDAAALGLLDIDAVLKLAAEPPCEIYFTGHNPPQRLVDACDYVSEVVCRAHPYEKGVAARRGVEY